MKGKIKKILATTVVSAVTITGIGCSTTNGKLAKNIDKSMAEFVSSINNLDYVETTKPTSDKVGKIVETSTTPVYTLGDRQIKATGNSIMFLNNDISEVEIENTITRPSERTNDFCLFVLTDIPFVTLESTSDTSNGGSNLNISTTKIEEASEEIDSQINTLILKRSILMIYVNEIYNGNVNLSDENKVALNAYVNVIRENTSFLNGNRGMVKNQLSLASDIKASNKNDNLVNYYIIKSGEALETRANKLNSTISAIDSIIEIIENNLLSTSSYYSTKLTDSYSNLISGVEFKPTTDSNGEINSESSNEEIAQIISNSLNFEKAAHRQAEHKHHHPKSEVTKIEIEGDVNTEENATDNNAADNNIKNDEDNNNNNTNNIPSNETTQNNENKSPIDQNATLNNPQNENADIDSNFTYEDKEDNTQTNQINAENVLSNTETNNNSIQARQPGTLNKANNRSNQNTRNNMSNNQKNANDTQNVLNNSSLTTNEAKNAQNVISSNRAKTLEMTTENQNQNRQNITNNSQRTNQPSNNTNPNSANQSRITNNQTNNSTNRNTLSRNTNSNTNNASNNSNMKISGENKNNNLNRNNVNRATIRKPNSTNDNLNRNIQRHTVLNQENENVRKTNTRDNKIKSSTKTINGSEDDNLAQIPMTLEETNHRNLVSPNRNNSNRLARQNPQIRENNTTNNDNKNEAVQSTDAKSNENTSLSEEKIMRADRTKTTSQKNINSNGQTNQDIRAVRVPYKTSNIQQ